MREAQVQTGEERQGGGQDSCHRVGSISVGSEEGQPGERDTGAGGRRLRGPAGPSAFLGGVSVQFSVADSPPGPEQRQIRMQKQSHRQS